MEPQSDAEIFIHFEMEWNDSMWTNTVVNGRTDLCQLLFFFFFSMQLHLASK